MLERVELARVEHERRAVRAPVGPLPAEPDVALSRPPATRVGVEALERFEARRRHDCCVVTGDGVVGAAEAVELVDEPADAADEPAETVDDPAELVVDEVLVEW